MLVGEYEYKAYTTIVKGLAGADLDIIYLIRKCQEITKLQCQLIQEKKAIDQKLDVKIALECRLEQQKAAILPNLKIPSPSVSSPNDKVVPKSYPCIIRKVAKRPSEQDNCQKKFANQTIVMTVSQIASCYVKLKIANSVND